VPKNKFLAVFEWEIQKISVKYQGRIQYPQRNDESCVTVTEREFSWLSNAKTFQVSFSIRTRVIVILVKHCSKNIFTPFKAQNI